MNLSAMEKNEIILVDIFDQPIGTGTKEEVHRLGLLHRAFSVLIVDQQNNMLLQQRAANKYHCPNLWTNACCSHPMPGEDVETAAHRRLQEELGFDCELTYIYHFLYRAEMENGLIEHEFDHVFIGLYDGVIQPNPDEVRDYQYLSVDLINHKIKEDPQSFTPWFLILMEKFNKKEFFLV